MLNNGIDPTGAKQAITHYSCEKCRPKQELYDINNITGLERDYGKITRNYINNLW